MVHKILIAVIITLLSLPTQLFAQGWTASIGGNVTLIGSAALFPRGTNSRPSIGVQEDTDSGIRFPAAGQISFVLDGTQEVLFSSAGFLINTDYLNFGSTSGSTGYGVRDNSGTVEYKNSGGSWATILTLDNIRSVANTWVLTQTFTVAPVFSSATATSVLAVDGSKALTTTFASASLTTSLSDETGTGIAVFATSPALVTPNLGTPTAIVLTSGTGLPISTGLTGAGTGALAALAVNVGSAGAFVTFNGALGTPASGTLTSATGLPVSTGISGFGTGVATALAVNTGSAGAVVLFNGALGTPASGTGTNLTGLPKLSSAAYAAATSAELFGIISDETGGGGVLVGSVSPALTTPAIGAATGASVVLTGAATVGAQFISNTSFAGDAALVATGLRLWAATGYGLSLQGFGTTSDFTIWNRADTATIIQVPANTTNILLSDSSGTVTVTNDLIIEGIQAGAAGDTDACLDVTTNELTDAGASTCIVSSLRFKSNWQPLNVGLREVLQLTPGSFYYTNDLAKVERIGLNAENMHAVEPRLAFYEPDRVTPRGVAYEETVALLTKAIQELTACVKTTNPAQCVAQLEAQ